MYSAPVILHGGRSESRYGRRATNASMQKQSRGFMLTISSTHFSWHKKQRSVAPRQHGDAKKLEDMHERCRAWNQLPHLMNKNIPMYVSIFFIFIYLFRPNFIKR